jgi:hypothetical protein
VLPFTAKPTVSMTCMYALFEYKDVGESDLVHIETHAGFFSVEDSDRVKKYRTHHDALIRASLTEEESSDLIRSVRDSLRKLHVKSRDAAMLRSIVPLIGHGLSPQAG